MNKAPDPHLFDTKQSTCSYLQESQDTRSGELGSDDIQTPISDTHLQKPSDSQSPSSHPPCNDVRTDDALLSPKNDFVFRKLFGDIANKDILIGFLQSVPDLDPSDYDYVEIEDPTLEGDYFDDKVGILDVKLRTRSGAVIDIEMQVCDTGEMRERLVFYLGKMVAEQMKRGDYYLSLKRTIVICISDFMLVDHERCHNRYRLRNDDNTSEFSDIMELNTLELPKLATLEKGTLKEWMRFFASDSEDELMDLAENNEPIKRAVAVIKEMSADELARARADAYTKARWDAEARKRHFHKLGVEEGIQQERERSSKETARAMLAKGFEVAVIAEITGLEIDAIENL